MEHLKKKLDNPEIRGVVRTADCEIIEFHNPGVKDLYNLLATRPDALEGAYFADRVIGRGAALLLVKGHVAQVFAQVISESALNVFQDAGIAASYDCLVPNIMNRDGTDMCPVEKLTMTVTQPDLAFEKIEEFLTTNKII